MSVILQNSEQKIIAAVVYQEVDNTYHIHALAVSEAYRKIRYATYLIQSLSSDQDVNAITANVLFTEISVLGFWKKLGFKEIEISEDEGYIGGWLLRRRHRSGRRAKRDDRGARGDFRSRPQCHALR